MHHRRIASLAGLVAALTIAVAASAASANILSFSERNLQFTWTALTFAPAVGTPARCAVTLSGSLHGNTLSKTVGSLIGVINSAVIGTCSEGSATALVATLPWHITYGGFQGRLPRISGVALRVIGASLQFGFEHSTCLTTTSTTEPFAFIANLSGTGQIASLRSDESIEIDLESFFCLFVGDLSYSGTGTVSAPGGRLVFIRLI